MLRTFSTLAFAAAVYGQQVGTLTAEKQPSMAIQSCTASGCTKEATGVVLDANWRWTHVTSGYTNCYDGNKWNATACPDGKTCAQNCALEGADYAKTYGITTPSDGALKLQFVTKNQDGANVGSRVYLTAAGDGSKYRMFDLLNKEFTFDVDVSNLPCGLNGAVYFSEMMEDGGMSAYPGNKAGAKYGTGYCDSQCPRDIKFINGEANVGGWAGSASDANSGAGSYGSCCAEMDIWEANLDAAAYTPHPCKVSKQTRCESDVDCGAGDANRHSGMCDPDGCDFNSFRMGNTDFYGTGKTVDTSKPFTIVTQFVTADGTDTGDLARINRFYVQGGTVIPNSQSAVTGIDAVNYISDDFCKQQKTAFGDNNYFATVGGLVGMGKSLKDMVLVLSVWDDHAVSMNWLDSNFPTTSPATSPGVARGRCDPAAGDPKTVETAHPDASVIYSNIKIGSLNSTFTAQ
ncbi:Exoglucanase 1 [Sporothrix bragantina]|uniref:Glucanase n=1 Tax=Sporothrix bragantina TaxID=671064 RepID=A0ABP0B2Y5_9PEZI